MVKIGPEPNEELDHLESAGAVAEAAKGLAQDRLAAILTERS
jgi:hypothetical protein